MHKLNLQLSRIAVAVVVGLSSLSAGAKTESLGQLTTAGATFGNQFWGWTSFTDFYTFSVAADADVGGKTVAYDSLWQDISLTSVLLQSWTGSTWTAWAGSSPNMDLTPGDFSFSGLTGGQYRLVLSGQTTPQIDLRDPLRPAYYQGTVRTLAAPVPEPGVMGMALLGLLGVGIASARRRGR